MNEALYAMGNGRICAYGYRGNIEQIFGAPYSSPSMGSLQLVADDGYKVNSSRLPGSAIWIHELQQDARTVASITEFADSELCCFIRKISAFVPLKFRYLPSKDFVSFKNNTNRFSQAVFALSIAFHREAHVYGRYVTGRELSNQLLWQGDVKWSAQGEEILFETNGECYFYAVGGENYADCIQNAELALEASFSDMLARTLRKWRQFSQQRAPFEKTVRSPELIQAMDDVSVLIKAQQSVDGGILAGHPYHLAYVRDMFGVSMYLLEVGHIKEVKMILEYEFKIFTQFGYIKNAQAMGIPGLFHIHENDQVEITGYLLIQAFYYHQISGETAFIEKIAPMLRWAFEVQEKELRRDMLPFNGDETYIAGHMLPRSTLFDGSAEATMLFLRGGELALQSGLIFREEERAEKSRLLERVKNSYCSNFYPDGRFIANQPARMEESQYPRFKYGICEKCAAHTFIEQTKGHRYLCPNCFGRVELPTRVAVCFQLPSVTLSPLFVGSDLLPAQETTKLVTAMIRFYNEQSVLPSHTADSGQVGYDFGFLLNALAMLKIPEGGKLYTDTLTLRDETGAWAEYYEEGKPRNARCRPWESAINLLSCLRYDRMQKEKAGL